MSNTRYYCTPLTELHSRNAFLGIFVSSTPHYLVGASKQNFRFSYAVTVNLINYKKKTHVRTLKIEKSNNTMYDVAVAADKIIIPAKMGSKLLRMQPAPLVRLDGCILLQHAGAYLFSSLVIWSKHVYKVIFTSFGFSS
jgi:hypothetical protein